MTNDFRRLTLRSFIIGMSFIPFPTVAQNIREVKVVRHDSLFRTVLSYDLNANITQQTTYLDTGDTLLKTDKVSYNYLNGTLQNLTQQDFVQNGWIPTYSEDINLNGALIDSEIKNTFPNGTKTPYEKTEYIYSVETNQLNELKKSRNTNGTWHLLVDETFSNYQYQTPIISAISAYSSDSLTVQYQIIRSINSIGKDSTLTSSIKAPGDSTWTTDEFYQWYYNNDGSLQSVRSKKWDAVDSIWTNANMTEYEYVNGKLTQEIFYSWQLQYWACTYQYLYNLDVNGNTTSYTIYEAEYSVWKPLMSILYSNFNGNTASKAIAQLEYWGSSAGGGTLNTHIPFTINQSVDTRMAQSVETSLTTDIVDTIDTISNKLVNVNIFPNPSDGIFNVISLQPIISWKVTSIDGDSEIEKNENSKNMTVDLSQKPSGVYLLNLNIENKNHIQKLIKR
jgi:Secretion system C-terminal sorting domain